MKTFILAITTLIPIFAIAQASSGDRLEVSDFKNRSLVIESILKSDPKATAQTLGARSDRLIEAIHTTAVECAEGIKQNELTDEHKLFWFESQQNTIYINCRRYFRYAYTLSDEVMNGLILHEYARKSENETGRYQISKNSYELFSKAASQKRKGCLINVGRQGLSNHENFVRELLQEKGYQVIFRDENDFSQIPLGLENAQWLLLEALPVACPLDSGCRGQNYLSYKISHKVNADLSCRDSRSANCVLLDSEERIFKANTYYRQYASSVNQRLSENIQTLVSRMSNCQR